MVIVDRSMRMALRAHPAALTQIWSCTGSPESYMRHLGIYVLHCTKVGLLITGLHERTPDLVTRAGSLRKIWECTSCFFRSVGGKMALSKSGTSAMDERILIYLS